MCVVLSYVTPLVVGYRWMPAHQGVVSGVITAGFGGGAVVFDQLASKVANPHNVGVQSTDGTNLYMCVRVRVWYITPHDTTTSSPHATRD